MKTNNDKTIMILLPKRDMFSQLKLVMPEEIEKAEALDLWFTDAKHRLAQCKLGIANLERLNNEFYNNLEKLFEEK